MKRKVGIFSSIAITGVGLLAIALSSVTVEAGNFLALKTTADSSYSLTLNSDNRITQSSGSVQTFTRKTAMNNDIQFDYSNCNASSGVHAVINSTGSITNVDPLNGISSFTPTFTTSGGELKFRASYDKVNWGDYAVLKSGVEYNFADLQHPNYIELSASGASVSLTSVNYYFECSSSFVGQYFEKVTSALSDYSGNYLIVDETSSVALKTVNEAANTFNVSITNNRVARTKNTDAYYLSVAKSGSSYTFKSTEGKYLDYATSSDYNELFWTSAYSSYITFNNGLFQIESSSHYLLYENSRFTYQSSSLSSGSRYVSLYKAAFDMNEELKLPVYDCGLSIFDKNANNYGLNDIFDNYINGDGLKVSLIKSNGNSTLLDKNQYSYVIKNGNTTVPSNVGFSSTGTFTVNISYNNYFTDSYSITVNEASHVVSGYTLVTDINELSVGQNVVIASSVDEDEIYAMTTEQKSNNRGASSVSINDGVLEIAEDTCEFELRAGTENNTFAFYDSTNNGFIYGGTSSNKLLTESTLSEASSFTVAIDSNGAATLVSQGEGDKDNLRFNRTNSPKLFACYVSTSAMELVSLYTKGAAAPVITIPVESITLNTSSITISDGGSYNLSVSSILPENATNKEVTWSSSDTSIASVDANGKVTGNSAGSAVITATAADGSGITATCNVTVNPVSVTGVSLDSNSIELFVGDSSTLTATVSPSNASNKNVTWTSSNETIATVEDGIVTGIKQGTATITVTTEDQGKHASCTVVVSNVLIETFSIIEESIELYVGQSGTTLSTSILPNNTTDKTITWASNNPNVATVDSDGVVTPVSEGNAVITATCGSLSDTCSVTVKPESELPTETACDFGFEATASECVVVKGQNEYNGVKLGTSKLGGSFTITIPAQTTKVIFYCAAWNGVSNSTLDVGVSNDTVVLSSDSISLTSDSGIANNSPFSLNGELATYRHELTLSNVIETTVLTFTSSKRCVAWLASYISTSSGGVTPSVVVVTGVSISPQSQTLLIDDHLQLSATVSPDDATNKQLTWTSSDTSVATVSSSGYVTAKAVGEAIITAKAHNNESDTCTITVVASGGGGEEQTIGTATILYSDAPTTYSSNTEKTIGDFTYVFNDVGNSYNSGYMQFKKNSSYLYNKTAIPGLKSITIDTGSNSFNGTVYCGSTSNSETTAISLSGGKYNITNGNKYFKIKNTASSAGYIASITIEYSTASINPTGLSLPNTESMTVGDTKTITATFSPEDCNTNMGLTWTSSDTSVATINPATGEISALKAGTTTIRATSTYNSSFTDTCTLTVNNKQLAKWTIFMYVCGANLESGGAGQATADLNEIKSVNNQPSDVNIVVEAGGAKDWTNTQNGCIDSSKLNRFHLRDNSYVKDQQISYSSMGLASTLQSFLEWGIDTYPANKYGLIFWNHGGGMDGVCFDEKKSNDGLTHAEVAQAVSATFENKNISKFDFVGYDACLMQMMEIAEFNSQYFKYQIGSQELENGTGWDYDTWVDDLYADKDYHTIFKAMCDGFINDNGGINAQGGYYQGTYYPADQTLSYLDLSYMPAFKTAWENMASNLNTKITNSNKSNFKPNVLEKTKYFDAIYDDWQDYAEFDCYHLMEKLESNSTFNPGSTYTSAVKTAINNLVGYNRTQQEAAANAHGISFYFGSAKNNSTYTNFSNWRSIVSKVGGY